MSASVSARRIDYGSEDCALFVGRRLLVEYLHDSIVDVCWDVCSFPVSRLFQGDYSFWNNNIAIYTWYRRLSRGACFSVGRIGAGE